MSATAATAATAANKTLRVSSAVEGNANDYSPFAKDFLRKHPSATLAAAIHALNCHMADMFLILVSILADKYGHSVDELIGAIKADERWTEAQVHPLVKSLTYFEQADVDTSPSISTILGKTQADMPVETLHDETTAPKKSRVSAKPKAEAAPEAIAAPKKTPAKKKATASVVEAVVDAAPAPVAEEAVPATPKKAPTKKAADATTEEVPPPAPKKAASNAKAAAAALSDADVDAAADAIASLTVSAVAAAAAAAKPKKTIARKPTVAPKAV